MITKILSSKLFVGIGLISYSLYLWHYPVFAFFLINDFTQGEIFKKILIAFIILFLSIISYYFIEKPARNKNYSFKIIFFLIFIAFIILLIFNLKIILNKGYKNRLQAEFQKEKTYQYLDDNSKVCFNNIEICRFYSDKKQKIILIGDSHFGSLSYNLKSRINKYQFIPITAAGYFYFDSKNVISIDIYTKKINRKFEKFNFIVDEELRESKNNIIIFGGSTSLYYYNKRSLKQQNHWGYEFVDINNLEHNSKLLEETFYNQLKKLTENNYVILIYPIPEMEKNFYKNIKNIETFKYTYDEYKKINKEIINYFDKIDLNNLIKIKPSTILCDESGNVCPLIDYKNNKLIYSDSLHPSLYGSELINNLIIKEIEKIDLKFN